MKKFIIVLIVVVVLGGGYYFIQQNFSLQGEEQVVGQIEGWNTYSGEEIGVTFQYPEDWEEKIVGPVNIPEGQKFIVFGNFSLSIVENRTYADLDDYKEKGKELMLNSLSLEERERIENKEVTFEQVFGEDVSERKMIGDLEVLAAEGLIVDGGVNYVISTFVQDGSSYQFTFQPFDAEKDREIFDALLQTVRFLN